MKAIVRVRKEEESKRVTGRRKRLFIFWFIPPLAIMATARTG